MKFSIYLNRHVFVMEVLICNNGCVQIQWWKNQFQKLRNERVNFSIFVLWYITKTYLYNFDPLKPHFYIVKLGFTGVYIIFLISAQNIDCGYLLEPPWRGSFNEYPQSMFCAQIWKISYFFYLKIFLFLVVKFSIYLNRCFFVMFVSVMFQVISLLWY